MFASPPGDFQLPSNTVGTKRGGSIERRLPPQSVILLYGATAITPKIPSA